MTAFKIDEHVEICSLRDGGPAVFVEGRDAVVALSAGGFYLISGDEDAFCDGSLVEGEAEFPTLEAALRGLYEARTVYIGEGFASRLEAALTEPQWAEVRRRNATPEYAGSVCASHDFIDANEVMAEAFEDVVGRPLALGEDDPRQDADFALWGAAWTYAKDTLLTAPATETEDADEDA